MGFKNLNNGDKFVADYNKYKAWKAKDSSERQQLYSTLNVNKFIYAKQTVYVAPFSFDALLVYATANAPANNAAAPCPTLLGLCQQRFLTDVPTGQNINVMKSSMFSPGKLARLQLKMLASAKTTKDASRITGSKYYRHLFNAASMPFGKKNATDTYENAVDEIMADAAYDNFLDQVNDNKKLNKITFIPEG